MQKLVLGHDDSFASPVERIFIATNGPEEGGCNNPLRQGLSADLADGHRPNNTLGGIPTIALDYSPAWDASLYEWTQDAINQGFRGQLREEFQVYLRARWPPYWAWRDGIRERRLLHQLSNRPATRLIGRFSIVRESRLLNGKNTDAAGLLTTFPRFVSAYQSDVDCKSIRKVSG